GAGALRAAPPAPRGHAVRTARSWRDIVAFTHPRTGGAHDSHHRTAGIAGRTRRRSGVVAARGACAAAQDAARRLCRYAAARGSTLYKFPEADGRAWLPRRSEFYLRLHPNTECRWL